MFLKLRGQICAHQELRIPQTQIHHLIDAFYASAASFSLSSLHALCRRDGDDDERVADDAGEKDDEDERDQHHLVRVDAHPTVARRTIC